MARSIIAVIASYVAMFALAFIGFTCAYLIVGSDVAFLPGIYEASTSWIGISFAINIVVAIIGGFICALIAKGGRASLALAILAVVLGLGVAFADMNKGKKNAGMVRTAKHPKHGSGPESVLAHLGAVYFSAYQRDWNFDRRKIEAARLDHVFRSPRVSKGYVALPHGRASDTNRNQKGESRDLLLKLWWG